MTFRVSVRGKFKGLSDAQRKRLADGAEASQVAFTDDGAFSYDRGLSVFTFRVQVPAEAEDDDDEVATLRALDALDAHGYPYEILKTAVTDMRTIKINRKGR
ncbi:DUF6204 family protein [Streptomyces boninensis]|uniref:DUF6204 family protein n=1 Tax=Streptomyces boninensis TaxID=2039455 RepID=UPI003B20BF89